MEDDASRSTAVDTAKKPYVQPRLESYGDLATVTQSRTGGVMNDTGSGKKTTT